MRNPARIFLLISAFILLVSACQPRAPLEPTPEPTATALPTYAPSAEPTPTPAPTLSPLPAVPQRDEPLFAWPLPTLTTEQIDAGRECRMDDLFTQRYQNIEDKDPQTLLAAYPPQNDCDWFLYISAVAQKLPEEEFTAGELWNILQNAVYQNPALMFSSPGAFFTANYYLDIAAPPPFTAQPLSQIKIHYDWQGIGDAVLFELSIDITDRAWITGRATYGDRWDLEKQDALTIVNIDQQISPDIPQAFGALLGNLIPVDAQGELFFCYDNYPNWVITFTYADGATLELVTDHSNIFDMGGPFQTQIDGQNYVLGSIDLLNAMWLLLNDLELDLGTTLAMSCFGRNYIDVVFPQP